MTARAISSYIVGLTTALLVFWAWITYPQALSDNNAVLIIYAERLLNGGQFGLNIFDTNPPLSILIYLPVAFAHKYLNIPIHFGNFIYPLLLLVLSVVFAKKILNQSTLKTHSTFILCLFTLGVTFSAPQSWGERDLLAFFGLFPYAFLIFTRTENKDAVSPRFALWVSIFSTVLILLKPHYGLLPLGLFIHRWLKTKSLKLIINSPEFTTPVIGTLIYALSVVVFFSGYLTDILPDTITLYAGQLIHPEALVKLSLVIGVVTLVIWGLNETSLKEEKLYPLRFFVLATLTTVGAFIAQSKGLFYHLVPAKTYFLIFCSLALVFHLKRFSKIKEYTQMIAFAVACGSLFLFFSPLYKFNTKESIKELPFSEILEERCPANKKCSAYIFHDAVNGVFTTFIYDDIEFTSRFSSLWWLPKLYLSLYEDNDLQNQDELRNKYTNYMREDLENNKPDVLIILKDVEFNGQQDKYNFNFVQFFSEDKEFRKALGNYRLIDTVTIDAGQYYSGTALGDKDERQYEVYDRKN